MYFNSVHIIEAQNLDYRKNTPKKDLSDFRFRSDFQSKRQVELEYNHKMKITHDK
jgi:hypothetical protein